MTYIKKPSYNNRQTINFRNWMEPKSQKPMIPHEDSLERGRIRRKTEHYLEKWELDAAIREVWE